MNVITVSREYGAGGAEVARRLAEVLGWELLDRELLHQAAQIEHVPDADLEKMDEQAVRLVDRLRIHPPHQKYMHGLTEAVKQAAGRGEVVLVGRGTRQILGDSKEAFHLRLIAPREWRARRMARQEGWSESEALTRCASVDAMRDRFTRYFFGPSSLDPSQFDLVINTARVGFDDIVALVQTILKETYPEERVPLEDRRRIITLSRELGAGDDGFAQTLAVRLDLREFDRELLEYQATRLGVSEAELEKIDEEPPGMLDRFKPGSLHHRYIEALKQLIRELAERGHVLFVGRGGSRILHDQPAAFHVRLVAPPEVRVRRVMEQRWLHEADARKLIASTDTRKQAFFKGAFGAEWANPLEYDLTVNTGRLGASAIEVVAVAAESFWTRNPVPSALAAE